MSSQAQYSSAAKMAAVSVSTANTNHDGTGTLGVLATGVPILGANTRLDRISWAARVTTAAGMLRFYRVKGRIGPAITAITTTGTTATVTTASAHDLTTGDKITTQRGFPFDLNVTDTATTVVDATHFTYVMATTPTFSPASTLPVYSTTPATPTAFLWREMTTAAATISGTVAGASGGMSGGTLADINYMPLTLEPGESIRVAPHNAEAWDVIGSFTGDSA